MLRKWDIHLSMVNLPTATTLKQNNKILNLTSPEVKAIHSFLGVCYGGMTHEPLFLLHTYTIN